MLRTQGTGTVQQHYSTAPRGRGSHANCDLSRQSSSNRLLRCWKHRKSQFNRATPHTSCVRGAQKECSRQVNLDSRQALSGSNQRVETDARESESTSAAQPDILQQAAALGSAAAVAAWSIASGAARAEELVPGPGSAVGNYTPGPVEVGWEIWFGAFVGVVPFAIGAYEFGKRILIQRRCEVCGGSGLIKKGRFERKCPQCGGFFPWRSWGEFLSANARPGNGGPLRAPKGQTSVFYKVSPPSPQSEKGPWQEQQLQPATSREEKSKAGSDASGGGGHNGSSQDP